MKLRRIILDIFMILALSSAWDGFGEFCRRSRPRRESGMETHG